MLIDIYYDYFLYIYSSIMHYDDWVNLYMELYILLFKENMTCKDSNEEFKYIL